MSKSRYHEWVDRAARAALDDLVQPPRCPWQVLPEEAQAVLEYGLAHPRDGYRRLTWMMVDEDVAGALEGLNAEESCQVTRQMQVIVANTRRMSGRLQYSNGTGGVTACVA